MVKVESNTTVQYQSYNIFLGFQFLVYEKVERIFLIISDYLTSRDEARPLANQSVRGGSRVDDASKKKYASACFLFVATSHAILP
jgi:hypothetical protein